MGAWYSYIPAVTFDPVVSYALATRVMTHVVAIGNQVQIRKRVY